MRILVSQSNSLGGGETFGISMACSLARRVKLRRGGGMEFAIRLDISQPLRDPLDERVAIELLAVSTDSHRKGREFPAFTSCYAPSITCSSGDTAPNAIEFGFPRGPH